MGKRNEYGDDAKHFKDVSALKATCIYCNTTINGGAERRRCHLARFKGRGVSVCTKVPVEVREQMLELQRKHMERKQRTKETKLFDFVKDVFRKSTKRKSRGDVPSELGIADEMEDMENTWENWLKAHNLPKTYLKSPDFRFAVQKTINYGSSIVYHVFQNFGEDEFQVDQLEEVVKSLPKRQRGNIIPM